MTNLIPNPGEVLVHGVFTPSLNKGFPKVNIKNPLEDEGHFELVNENVIFTGVVKRSELNASRGVIDVVVDKNFTMGNEMQESYQAFQKRQKKNPFARPQNVHSRGRRIRIRCKKEFLFTDREDLMEELGFFMAIEYDPNEGILMDGSNVSEVIEFFREEIGERSSGSRSLSVWNGLSSLYDTDFLAELSKKRSLSFLFKEKTNEELEELNREYSNYTFSSLRSQTFQAGRGMGKSMLNSIYGQMASAVQVPAHMLQPQTVSFSMGTIKADTEGGKIKMSVLKNRKGSNPCEEFMMEVKDNMLVDEASMVNPAPLTLPGDFDGDIASMYPKMDTVFTIDSLAEIDIVEGEDEN